MGHSSKFTFPLPGRKTKPAPPSPPSAPLTKAQKILGTAEISHDSATLSPDPKWGWETTSNSGISVAVSGATVSYSEGGEVVGLGISQVSEAMGTFVGQRGRWEDESEIIPRGLHGHGNMAVAPHDMVTDASSLRRRQSSSTITSFYDKTKLPLSISQQTSNSAMAKGLPPKAHAILDIDGAHNEHKSKKKKPSRLDLSSLLSKGKTPKYLKAESYKHLVLGNDMMTKSPSLMSLSPDATPPPIPQRAERTLRKKLTRESMKEAQPAWEAPLLLNATMTGRPHTASRSEGGRHRRTKSAAKLINLYDHYEQRSFADILEQDVGGALNVEPPTPGYPTPPASCSSGNTHAPALSSKAARIAQPNKQTTLTINTHDLSVAAGTSPSSLMSPPADTASVSSRHTRTSKASKRTDRSDIDLQQNSMLSLSSDSEDDSYEHSCKDSLAVPAPSDGQTSPTSPHSAVSQRSAASAPQETSRAKPPRRTNFANHTQFRPIPEGTATLEPPRINARTSSLLMNAAANRQSAALAHLTSRLSIGTTSTGRTVSCGVAKSDGTNAVDTPTGDAPARPPCWSATNVSRFDDFPAPPTHRPASAAAQRSEQPTPPLSPTSVDLYLQSQQGARRASDNRSVSSGRSLGSAARGSGGRPGSAASSVHDASSGRFMAVTRQEEMLLAALRMKRARMREDIIAEFEDKADHDDRDELQRQMSIGSGSGVSRQSSMSTMRTIEAVTSGTLTARPQRRPPIRVNPPSSTPDSRRDAKASGHGHILVVMDRSTEDSPGFQTEEPNPDLDSFTGFEDEAADHSMLRSPSPAEPERRSNRAGSKAGAGSASSRGQRGLRSNKGTSNDMHPPRRDVEQSSLRSGVSRRGSNRDKEKAILEDPREEEEEEEEAADVPRPDSPISPFDFPVPTTTMTRKKQVRLSAVGNHKPNVEAGWWDDSG